MAEHLAPSEEPHSPQHTDGPGTVPSEPAHRADGDSPARHRRRVQTDAPVGSDPNPEPEAPRLGSTENDEQLKRDKPPHWG